MAYRAVALAESQADDALNQPVTSQRGGKDDVHVQGHSCRILSKQSWHCSFFGLYTINSILKNKNHNINNL